MANSSIKNLNIDGNVIISGSTTSIDVQQLTTDDTNITLNDIASPGDPSADGGGFTLKGATDKTFNWVDATDSWTSSEHIDLVATKEYKINTISVLNATTLGAGVVNSSLTDVGTLTSLQIDNIFIDGSQIGLKTTDEDLITLTANTVTVAGTVAATAVTGDGSGITGLTTSNIVVPASPGDFLYNNAGAWGGITPPISVALGGTGATTAAAARTALGVTATGADTAYNLRANNLNDVANAATARTNLGLGTMAVETATNYLLVGNDLSEVGNSTARTNLGLGTANSPKFGGVGTGTVTIEATPSSGGTVAPTFSGTSFKSIPVASGSGHKWVVGNEQAGNLTFSYFTINDAGANTSSAVGYITLDPANTRVELGNTGGTPVNVVISGLGYPTADGTAGYVLKTDGAANLSWTSISAAGALLAANNLSDLANAATSRTNLGVANTTNIAEGTNEYWTNAKFDTRFTSKGINSLSDTSITSPVDNHFLFYNNSVSEWINGAVNTSQIVEHSSNLYYTDARADARIDLETGVNLDLTSVSTSTLSEGTNLYYTDARADARIVNAGSANWNTAYTGVNTATDAATNNMIVKRGSTGNIAVSKLTADNGVVLGNMPSAATGGIQWSGTDFLGYKDGAWVSLTSAATAQISGAVATFTTSPTVTSTSFTDISGYTSSITVTNSNIINVQVNVDLDGPEGGDHSFVQLVRVVSGTPTVLYEDESGSSAAGEADHFNITYADTHGQSSGTVITYKLMAKVTADTLTVNPNGTNAQIFLQEMTTSPTTVSSVNGATGTVVLDTDDISEGTNNKYFTTSGATVNTDNLAEGSTNLYHQDDLGSV